MKFEIKESIDEKNLEDVLKGYYHFFEKMYGKSRVPLIKKDVEYSLEPKSVIDKNDGNLIEAIKTIKELNETPELYSLNILDEEDNLIAMARFKVNSSEEEHEEKIFKVHVGEILLLKSVSVLEAKEIYESVLNYLVEYMKNFGEEFDIYVEVLKNDSDSIYLIENAGYKFEEDINYNIREYRTVLLKKHITLENEKLDERNSSR